MAIDQETLCSSASKIEMDETSRLLSPPPSTAPQQTNEAQLHRRRAYVVIFLLLACFSLSVIIFEPAQARLFESAYCQAWYQDHEPALVGPGGVEEAYCKIPQVQRDVASLSGMRLLPGIFHGDCADRHN